LEISTAEGITQFGSGALMVNGVIGAGPINVHFRSTRGQFVYTAEELKQAGVDGINGIGQIGFFVSGAPARPLPSFHVRIKHTSAINAAEHDDGPWEATHIIPNYTIPSAVAWRMITLSQPFV
jgi:hypothetical protein